MNLKIFAFLSMVITSLGCEVSWGQHFANPGSSLGAGPWQKRENSQYTESFFNSLTNITPTERAQIDFLRDAQSRGELRKLRPSELPENYGRMTQEQRDIYVILYLAAEKVQESTAYYTNLYANNKAALLRPKTVPLNPWRKIGGKTVYVLSSDSGFMNCAGTVIQSMDGGVLVKPLLDISGNYFIKNFPFQVADGYELDAAKFMAKKVGFKKYTNVLGSEQTVTEMDYGEPCDRPNGGETIEAEAQEPDSYEQKQLQEIDSSLSEKLNVAAAAKKRLADFVQKIDNDKIAKIQEQKQRQEAAKNAALKSNQNQADKGDAYGLLRMGERYRDGDGVVKDLAKAKEYLTRAAAAGSPTAADELSKLDQSSKTTKPAP